MGKRRWIFQPPTSSFFPLPSFLEFDEEPRFESSSMEINEIDSARRDEFQKLGSKKNASIVFAFIFSRQNFLEFRAGSRWI